MSQPTAKVTRGSYEFAHPDLLPCGTFWSIDFEQIKCSSHNIHDVIRWLWSQLLSNYQQLTYTKKTL